ncbi:MAG: hypothetical protein J6X89_07095 [Bacteroidales bacterium]|nr:hypothetical protein [Bacteroidales bacterium]
MKKDAKKFRLGSLIPYAGIVAVLVVVVLAFTNQDREFIDTFDDPSLAYAQVEEAFKQISDNMAKGVEMADNNE